MTDKNDNVTVKAIRSFQGDEGYKSPDSKPFQTSRHRAAELMANKLVEIVGENKRIKEPAEVVRKSTTKRKG